MGNYGKVTKVKIESQKKDDLLNLFHLLSLKSFRDFKSSNLEISTAPTKSIAKL